MSYNIRYGTAADGKNSWKHRRSLLTTLLHDQEPDIIGTQEALRFQLDEICDELGYFSEIGVGRDDGKTAGEYSAILYRNDRFKIKESGTFWFSDSPRVPGTCHWGNNQPRICTWALLSSKSYKKLMYIYNIHLDHRSDLSRRKSIQLLKSTINGRRFNVPVVITGDFNVTEGNLIIKDLKGDLQDASVRFVDTYRKHNKYSISGTFNLFTGYRFGPRIDYIFAQETFNVYESSIIRTSFRGRYPSDHFPVSTKLGLVSK